MSFIVKIAKHFYFVFILGALVLAACGKDENATSTPQAVPNSGTPAPAAPPPPAAPPANNPQQTHPQPQQPNTQPAPNQGGNDCFCDWWGCYTCGADDWCCEVDSCNWQNQHRLGNYFSRSQR